MDNLELTEEIIRVLKLIYDPEIPVNIYDLGLIYEVNVDKDNNAEIVMTLTAPNCPIADQIVDNVNQKVNEIEQTNKVDVKLTFDPPWEQSMMSEEAKLELGFL